MEDVKRYKKCFNELECNDYEKKHNELEELQVALARILCLSSLQIGDPDLSPEDHAVFHNARVCRLLGENPIIQKHNQIGYEIVTKVGIVPKLPSERIRELCREPGVYTVVGIIKYLDEQFRKGTLHG